ncbi:hypothetical protein [Bradyrhizobium liaoningense]|uniref:hypothetical protein n=1 Tax=Bradyrhizobium liaoningense TaxID=43992 RepID=UPI0020130255|nr:hypothetical protein [Bradyrhizobium liaoningense]
MPADQGSCCHDLGPRRGIADQAAVAEGLGIEGVAETGGSHRGVADLAEIRAAAPRAGGKSRSAMMAATEMCVAETMSATVVAATAMPTSMMTTAVAATMTTPMASLGEGGTRKHTGQRHRNNSNDRSQHLILRNPQH